MECRLNLSQGLVLPLLAMAGSVLAEDGPAVLPKVAVEGAVNEQLLRREFTAGKIVITRRSLEDSGLVTVDAVLRREPSVTVSSDGKLGLMGLPGYTQVLLDGAPAPAGRNPLEQDLAHVERIEIIKSATAQTGPFGMAGTINIITRKLPPRAMQQWRIGLTQSLDRHDQSLAMTESSGLGQGPFGYLVNLSFSHRVRLDREYSLLIPADQESVVGDARLRQTTDTLLATSSLTWRQTPERSINWAPAILDVRTRHQGEREESSQAMRTLVGERQVGRLTDLSAPVTWEQVVSEGAQWTWKINPGLMVLRQTQERRANNAAYADSLSGRGARLGVDLNYAQSLAAHDLKAGAGALTTRSHRDYLPTVDGQPDGSLQALVGQQRELRQRGNAFVEDDWRLDKRWAINAGLRYEQSRIRLQEGSYRTDADYRLWAPSVHLAWKLDDKGRRQWRLSLARTFNAPYVDQLSRRPKINPLALCPAALLCGANPVEYADSVGNPALRPERSRGVNLSYEHQWGDNSRLRVETFTRDIRDVIGTVLSQEPVPWASVPRFISRPENLGRARIHGLALEGNLRLSELAVAWPRLNLRGAIQWARSTLDTVPGPDNRFAGQAPWSGKLGLGYRFTTLPLEWNIDANARPGFWVRNDTALRYRQGRRVDLGSQWVWSISPRIRLTMNADNLLAQDLERVDEFGSPQTSLRNTVTRRGRAFGLNLQLRL